MLRLLAAFLAGAALVTAAPVNTTNDIIPNQWVLTFKSDVPDTVFTKFQQHFRRRSEEGTISVKYQYDMGPGSLRGFALRGSSDAVMAFQDDDWVGSIEPDRWLYTQHRPASTSTPASWNLEAISHLGPLGSPPQEGRYLCPENCGGGAFVYVLDTGIRYHTEFAGRAEHGWTACEDYDDHVGHGTHVAGIVGGEYRGVAFNTTIINVKVLCNGASGPLSDVVKGIEWVIRDVEKTGRTNKAVINLSLGAYTSHPAQDPTMAAVREAVKKGIFVAIAAGNDGKNVDGAIPAAESSACTVAAIDEHGGFASFSNWGKGVDILAPGVNIEAASNKHQGWFQRLSGTSMAAPHVAGVAATWLASGRVVSTDFLCEQLMSVGEINRKSRPEGTTAVMLNNAEWGVWA